MFGPLTVGIITFNEEKRIQECLRSLEFLPPFHLVMVDNNSTDQTIAIAEKILAELQFDFTLIERDRNNLAQARNDILNVAQTPWVYMLDADCRLDDSTWPELVQNWSDDPQIAACAGSQKFSLNHEILVLLDEMRNSYLGHFGSAQMKSKGPPQFLEHVSTTHVLYRKEALLKAGGFNPLLKTSAEDLEMSLRLRKKGYYLQFNPHSFLWHELAESWGEWARKAFRNGVWQTRLIAYNFEILKTRRPWPGLFLFFLPTILAYIPWQIGFVLISAYILIILAVSFNAKLTKFRKIKLCALFLMTHFLYAIGEVFGVVLAVRDSILNKKLPASTKNW